MLSPSHRLSTAMLRLAFFLFLVLDSSLGMLQPEHSVWERSLGTSFSTAPGFSSGSKQTHMQVCITIGCCRHVCRQFMGETSPARDAEIPESIDSAARAESTPSSSIQESMLSRQVAVVPEFLEWTPQALFSPSIKHLTVFNTANDSVLRISLPVQSKDEQFYSQGSGDDDITIAPGGSLRIPVLYLPQQLGQAAEELILRTSAGDHPIQVRGQGSESPYRLSDHGEPETVDGELRRVINFHNPHHEAIQINEVQVWSAELHRGTLCSMEADRITSCIKQADLTAGSADGFYSSGGSEVTLNAQLGTWEIRPGETAEMVELEYPKNGTWTGILYVEMSRNDLREVIILPLRPQASKSAACNDKSVELPEIQLGVRPGTGTDNPLQETLSGKKTQQLVDSSLRPLIRDLTAILLKQPEVKVGSLLSTSQSRAMLMPEQMVSFPTVRTRSKERLWIDLVNPSEDPVTVKLEVAQQVKSTGCRHKGSWLWQNQEAKIQQNEGLFYFEEGAVIQAVIPALSKLSAGPLTFHPEGRCEWYGLLFLKNSLSGLEWVPVHGRGGAASISFLEGSHSATVKRLHLAYELVTGMPTTEVCQRRMETTFGIKNTGEMGMSIDGLHIGTVGFKLGTVGKLTLEAGEMTDLVISYEPDYEAAATKAVLELATSIGVVHVPVIATVPRELLAVCGNVTFEEKVLLPLSICALVLVLAIFTRLLLQEVLSKEVATKPKPEKLSTRLSKAKQTWRRVFSMWKQSSKKLRSRGADGPVAESVKTEQEVDKCKVPKKKKKNRSASSQPCSPVSASAPCSPRSSSDSEKKEIERILDASRFSLSKSLSKKKITSMARKEQVRPDRVTSSRPVAEARSTHQEEIQHAAPRDGPVVVTDISNGNAVQVQTTQASSETSSGASLPVAADKSTVTAPLIPATLRAPGARAAMSHEAENKNAEPLTSIGQLRKRAAALSSENMEQEPGQYDIWGDHFAKISTGDRQSFSFSHHHSLFSQSFPASIQDVSCSSSCYYSSTIPSRAAETHEQLARAYSLFTTSSNEAAETYPGPSSRDVTVHGPRETCTCVHKQCINSVDNILRISRLVAGASLRGNR